MNCFLYFKLAIVQGESSLNVDRYFLFTIYHKNSFQYLYEIKKEKV